MSKTAVRTGDPIKQNLNRYAGEWVAFVDGRVVGHDEKLKGLMKKIEIKGFSDKASIFLVPRKDEGPYVLIISK
ncbi:MAG: DUF5678 domain-containing protein [Patescibacteria group bacterium]